MLPILQVGCIAYFRTIWKQRLQSSTEDQSAAAGYSLAVKLLNPHQLRLQTILDRAILYLGTKRHNQCSWTPKPNRYCVYIYIYISINQELPGFKKPTHPPAAALKSTKNHDAFRTAARLWLASLMVGVGVQVVLPGPGFRSEGKTGEFGCKLLGHPGNLNQIRIN